jgi:hypothetical protein
MSGKVVKYLNRFLTSIDPPTSRLAWAPSAHFLANSCIFSQSLSLAQLLDSFFFRDSLHFTGHCPVHFALPFSSPGPHVTRTFRAGLPSQQTKNRCFWSELTQNVRSSRISIRDIRRLPLFSSFSVRLLFNFYFNSIGYSQLFQAVVHSFQFFMASRGFLADEPRAIS